MLAPSDRRCGKRATVAIVACMRKLLIIPNSMIRKNMNWQQFVGPSTPKNDWFLTPPPRGLMGPADRQFRVFKVRVADGLVKGFPDLAYHPNRYPRALFRRFQGLKSRIKQNGYLGLPS